MNNRNLSLLQAQIRYLGFGEQLASNDLLNKEIEGGEPEFQLTTAACFDEWTTIKATLIFRWSKRLDLYFFSGFDALLIYNLDPIVTLSHTFYLKNGNGVTFKEAFNLLQGRSVYTTLWNSDEVKYKSWIRLSSEPGNTEYFIRKYGEKYGYDLEKALSAYPIRELNDPALKAHVIQSLQKGNLHPVTFIKANKIEKMYIEACPATKGLKLYSELLGNIKMFPSRIKTSKK